MKLSELKLGLAATRSYNEIEKVLEFLSKEEKENQSAMNLSQIRKKEEAGYKRLPEAFANFISV